jgi:outer membrane protein assembly factor BamA
MIPLIAIAENSEVAQQEFPFVVDTIIVEGAQVTKPFVILREMDIEPGDAISEGKLEENRKRVQNLGLFTRVEVYHRRRNQRNEVLVQVTERWYIFLLPFWHKEGGDFSKITYGIEYLQKNFRGRNERIAASVWTGEERGYQLAYFNPWLAGRGTWGLAAEAFEVKRDAQNAKYRDVGAEIHTSGARVSIQRRFGLDTRLAVTLGVTRYRTDYRDLLIGGDSHDDWMSLNIAYVTDERDLYEYPTRGWYKLVNLSWNSLANDLISDGKTGMATVSLELRHYQQILLDFILCQRAIVSAAAGDVPLYRRYFLGDGIKVRGWKGDTEEGEGIFLGSMEIRHRLFDINYFTWKSAPAFKKYFRNLKYGLSAGLFLDVGQVWMDPSQASYRKFQSGWGIGLHVHVPYLDLLRLEAGWCPESSFKDAKLSMRSRVAF